MIRYEQIIRTFTTDTGFPVVNPFFRIRASNFDFINGAAQVQAELFLTATPLPIDVPFNVRGKDSVIVITDLVDFDMNELYTKVGQYFAM